MILKRLFDFFLSFFGLIFLSPLLLPVILLVWLQDFKSPFYISYRTGKNEEQFKMVKLRSMIVDADKSGVDSTSSNDKRITKVGKFIRKFKLDELTQLWNVLRGDMSLVGPRPNVKKETDMYTIDEKNLLVLKPGITDFSSIVFSDEGEILENKTNPDLAYNQLIRPWKSRLGLIYVNNQSFILDIQLIIYTLISIFSKEISINWIVRKLKSLNVNNEIISIAKRKIDLYPHPPPGNKNIVTER